MAHVDHTINLSVDPLLARVFQMQRDYQTELLGEPPHNMAPEAKMAYIREQSLALIVELTEALNETGWKSWASSNHINRDAYASELCADVFRFFLNLCLVANIQSSELIKSYMDKHETVLGRMREGYDGLSGKCPGCHRDLKDKGVQCTEIAGHDTENKPPVWCQVYGYVNSLGDEMQRGGKGWERVLPEDRLRRIVVRDGMPVSVHEMDEEIHPPAGNVKGHRA